MVASVLLAIRALVDWNPFKGCRGRRKQRENMLKRKRNWKREEGRYKEEKDWIENYSGRERMKKQKKEAKLYILHRYYL